MNKKLLDYIDNAEYYEKEFSTWESTEKIIDDDKAFWMLRKPGSEYKKVCLYRDGCNMFVYGDYGQFTFDSMTWIGSVCNLEYDNISYQMEKLDRDSRSTIDIYDPDKCEEEIYDWLRERLENRFCVDDEVISKVVSYLEDNHGIYTCDYEVEEFCEECGFSELKDIIAFTNDALSNTDEYEWIKFLRSNYNRLDDFDEACECVLWNAGKCIHQRYFICMYALQECGEKLMEQKENN